MARKALWRGSKALTEAPDSPEWDFGNDKDTCTRVFVGPYATCLSGRPAYGANMADMPADLRKLFFVTGVKVRRAPGGKGLLTVTLQRDHMAGAKSLDRKETDSQYEIEWTQVERPLEQHPVYAATAPGWWAGIRKPLTSDDLNALAMWEKEEDYTKRKAFQFTDKNGDEVTLSSNAQHLAGKKLRGQEAFLMFSPVVRKITQMRACPDGSACGRRVLTPRFVRGALRKYRFLKTADRGTRSGDFGRWERTREYTGADEWDSDIYRVDLQE